MIAASHGKRVREKVGKEKGREKPLINCHTYHLITSQARKRASLFYSTDSDNASPATPHLMKICMTTRHLIALQLIKEPGKWGKTQFCLSTIISPPDEKSRRRCYRKFTIKINQTERVIVKEEITLREENWMNSKKRREKKKRQA